MDKSNKLDRAEVPERDAEASARKCIPDSIALMVKYLDGTQGELTWDEREVLLFALFIESRLNPTGIANLAIRVMNQGSASAALPHQHEPKGAARTKPDEFKDFSS